MSALLAVVSTVVATPVPTPTPLVEVVTKLKEVQVTPSDVNQFLIMLALGALGYAGSWLQAFINSHKKLHDKVNVGLTALYGIFAPVAVVLYQSGQLNFSSLTKGFESAGIVLLAAWVRHNGAKINNGSTSADNSPGGTSAAAGTGALTDVPRKATT